MLICCIIGNEGSSGFLFWPIIGHSSQDILAFDALILTNVCSNLLLVIPQTLWKCNTKWLECPFKCFSNHNTFAKLNVLNHALFTSMFPSLSPSSYFSLLVHCNVSLHVIATHYWSEEQCETGMCIVCLCSLLHNTHTAGTYS